MTLIGKLKLKPKIENALASGDIRTIESLVKKSDEELLEIRDIGPQTIREISNALAAQGLSLRGGVVVSRPVIKSAPNATLRDYFAGEALRCLVIDPADIHSAALAAYRIADALLVARNHSTDYAGIGAK